MAGGLSLYASISSYVKPLIAEVIEQKMGVAPWTFIRSCRRGVRFTRASVAIESADGYHFSVDAGGHVGLWSSSAAIRLLPSQIRASGFPALGSS